MKKQPVHQEVKKLVTTFLKTKEVSQNKLAEMIGISPATITNVVNENWEKLNESMLLKIRSYFTTKEWVAVDTSNFSTIKHNCNEARQLNKMIGIIGCTGAGKTFALRNYYENNSNTYLVTCSRAMRTKQFLAEILKGFGVHFIASDYEMTKRIINEMNKKIGTLLIIDEASKLSANALMYVQDIWDGVEDSAGIVLAGVEYLHSNIKKASDKNKIGMPEFYSRVNYWETLIAPKKSEIKSICKHNNVTDETFVKTLYRLGNFRLIRNAIQNLKTI